MVSLSFPDGSVRDYDDGITGADLALSISKSLSKKALAYSLDGELMDLADPITQDGQVAIITRNDEAALELIRHDTAHVMAEAVQSLWPDTQVTIGPVIDDGFFYEFARDETFRVDDLETIEAKMHEIIKLNAPFNKEVWSRDEAKTYFADKGEHFKVELVDAIPEGEDVNSILEVARGRPRKAFEAILAMENPLLQALSRLLRTPGQISDQDLLSTATQLAGAKDDALWKIAIEMLTNSIALMTKRHLEVAPRSQAVANAIAVWEKTDEQLANQAIFNLDKKQTIVAILDAIRDLDRASSIGND